MTSKPHTTPEIAEQHAHAPTNNVAKRLETAYTSLKNRFTGLNVELEETNAKLLQKISELDLLTQYLDKILSNISQGLMVVNDQGEITTYNTAAEEILGVPGREALFHKFWDAFADDYLGFPLKEALKKKQCPGVTETTITRDGMEPQDLEIDTTFLTLFSTEAPDEAALPMQGLIVLIRDVTSYRKLQVIAQRKSRMNELGEIASIVAHEIRNPLGGIKGFAALLERDLVDRPELQKMAAYITKGTDNLNELVTQILNYARPPQIDIQSTDIVPLLQELRKHVLSDQTLCQNAEIVLQCEESSLMVPIDPQAIHATMLNLVRNALQAMQEGGTVTISLARKPAHVILRVADAGDGISPENLKKIYSPFFTTRPDGNGFGLSEVRKVVQAHEGTIDVESTVNQGTTFTVKLPLKR